MNKRDDDTRIKLLCELAHKRVEEDGSNGDCPNKYIIPNYDNSGTKYNEEGQDLFNDYYDEYEGIILNSLELVENLNYK